MNERRHRVRAHPSRREARGTAHADSFVRDIRFAWRSLRRTPLAALTIVVTVALGLGLVAGERPGRKAAASRIRFGARPA